MIKIYYHYIAFDYFFRQIISIKNLYHLSSGSGSGVTAKIQVGSAIFVKNYHSG